MIQCSSFRIPSRDSAGLTGRQRRRLYEWDRIVRKYENSHKVIIEVSECDPAGVPLSLRLTFLIRSICGISEDLHPVFSDKFEMELVIPENYPQADAPVQFRFIGPVRPWHPNIVYYGDAAGMVCVNQLTTFTEIVWGIERVEAYLKYELYHAEPVAPYPVDLKVAEWVRTKGEPCGWIFYDQD